VARLSVVSLAPFEQVVIDHGHTVLRVCRALLPAHDAEDAAAEALLSALQGYPKLSPDSNVKGWLVTIAHRKALDILRRRTRQALPVADVPEQVAGGEPPLADEALWTAVRALPDRQRHAVTYRYVADLPYADVAELMGASEAAVRRSAADGIKALRRAYSTSVPFSHKEMTP
jgi:RNA polymerase sigma factor (sigma-70 family)